MTNKQNVAQLPTKPVEARLPMPISLQNQLDPGRWRVLIEATFPNAQTAEAVEMAWEYCKARGLDIFKRPVHIVPMWSTVLKRNIETVWPGINELLVTAARTKGFAGMDNPVFGPETTETFSGRKQIWANNKPTDRYEELPDQMVTFPEWCSITVYRMVEGQRVPFVVPVFWTETYSTEGGKLSRIPTEMWRKRPRGQLQKCALAASLRVAFPEELGNQYAAEEMEGKSYEAAVTPRDGSTVIEGTATVIVSDPAINEDAVPEEVKSAVATVIARCMRNGAWNAARQWVEGVPSASDNDRRWAFRELQKAEAAYMAAQDEGRGESQSA